MSNDESRNGSVDQIKSIIDHLNDAKLDSSAGM